VCTAVEETSMEAVTLLQRDLGTELAEVQFTFRDGRTIQVINSREVVPIAEEE